MGSINPIKINGKWSEGYAIDYHSVYSIYMGEDQWGRPQYDTQRTEIGNLIYELKYRSDQSKVEEIIKLIAPFLDEWNIKDKIDCIIPVPPTTKRTFQPVYEISSKIGEYLDKLVYLILHKNSPVQSKNLSNQKQEISGTITKHKNFNRRVNLLIVDDLFQSGRTLTEVVQVLKTDVNVRDTYVLTMTKTRR